jgi:hypothetical protein
MRASIVHHARARRLGLTALAGLGVALVLYLRLWHCPVAELFGVPCPGCGLTRAVAALLALDFGLAVELHPLSPLLVSVAAFAAADALVRFVRGSRARASLEPLAVLLLALLIGVWVSRFFGAFGGPVRVVSHLGG